MKLLFITLCPLEVNTSVTKSNLGLLKGFEELGFEITILMPGINKDVYYFDKSIDLSRFKIVRINNETLGQTIANMQGSSSKIKTFLFKQMRTLYNQLSLFDRSKQYLAQAPKLSIYDEYYDIVISTSDPKTSHMFVDKMIKCGLNYGKWIQHWGDPLLGDVSRRNIYPSWYIKRVERNILKNADSVVYVSPFTAASQKANHPMHAIKINFAPLMCDDGDRRPKNVSLEGRDLVKLAFVGDYNSQTRDILPLYEACKKMKNVELTIAGNTDLILESIDTIHVYKRVPQAQAKEMEQNADIIVSVGNRFGTQIPGKIYYLASTDKIILITMEDDKKVDMKEYFDSFGRYETCDNKTSDIIEAVKKIINKKNFSFTTPERLFPVNIVRSILESI